MNSALSPSSPLLSQMAAMFRQGTDASLATAMTLLIQRPDAHLPLMQYGDARVSLRAIHATIDLYEGLNPETRQQIRTLDIAHLEELHPIYPGEISKTLERLGNAPVRHHDAVAARAREPGNDPARTLSYRALTEWMLAEVYLHAGNEVFAAVGQIAARNAMSELLRTPGHVSALNRMATRALRAGLWCFGLLECAAVSDAQAFLPMVAGILSEEIERSERFGNAANQMKLSFEVGLAAHARGNLKIALKRYGEAYSAAAPREGRLTTERRRTIAVLMAVCEQERDAGISPALASRITDQIRALRGDPEHAGLIRWLDALVNRFLSG